MTYCYRNRDGAELFLEGGESPPAGYVPRAQFKAWRAAGFPSEDAPPSAKLDKEDILADLDRLGIEHDKRWGRDRLDALLREGKAAREAAVNASVE